MGYDMNKPIITVTNVFKQFEKAGTIIKVLNGMSFVVAEKERIAVVGVSGTGKSTLLHILGTLDRPTSGSVHYHNDDVTRKSDVELSSFRNKNIGFVFQFHYLIQEFTALENVMIPGLIAGEKHSHITKRAKKLLTDVGLSHRMSHKPPELSGGEQQRVAIARALIMNPSVVFADEPTGNLDPATGETVAGILFEINEKMGTTLVIVTHNYDIVEKVPRVIRIHNGQSIEEKGHGTSTH